MYRKELEVFQGGEYGVVYIPNMGGIEGTFLS